ncbi:MAG: glycogen synthase GlgA [Saccharofermentanales bacterium]|jgi:starch synthase
MKILFVSSELSPLAHTGGLGDVVAALPAALLETGHDARIIIPLYRQIRLAYGDDLEFMRWTMIQIGWRTMYSGLFRLQLGDVTVYLIDNEYFFGHDDIYLDYTFDIERFAFFQRAVLEVLGEPLDFQPDILHLNDWQTAMIPVLLEAHYRPHGYHTRLKTVLTIHNLKYQGVHGRAQMQDLFDLPESYFTDELILKDGVPNFLKAGILFSDHITTVSPTYAAEILTDYFGEGLNYVLRAEKTKLTGILNGIDTVSYDPATDPVLPSNYDVTTWLSGKTICKKSLTDDLGLTEVADNPLLVMVTRLTNQKGIDLLLHIADELLTTTAANLVILGTGDENYELRIRDLAARHPEQMRAIIEFDPVLARQLYAASDLFLMPSLFEPCGLSQMIAMRYGSLPVVRQTGGLADTVQPYNQYDGSGNGFGFLNINAHELLFTTKDAIELYENDPAAWASLVETAMSGDYSWLHSAREYAVIYQAIIPKSLPDEAEQAVEAEQPKQPDGRQQTEQIEEVEQIQQPKRVEKPKQPKKSAQTDEPEKREQPEEPEQSEEPGRNNRKRGSGKGRSSRSDNR